MAEPQQTVNFPRFNMTLGFWAAVVIALVVCIFWAMGLIAKEPALLTLAVCANRL